jgi:hypothetical protein
MVDIGLAVEQLLRGRCERAMRKGTEFVYKDVAFTPRTLQLAITDAVLVVAGATGVIAGKYAQNPVQGVMSQDSINPLQVFPLTAAWQNPNVTLEDFLPLVDATFESFILPNAHDLTPFFLLAEQILSSDYQAENRLFFDRKTAEAIEILERHSDTHDMTTGDIAP